MINGQSSTKYQDARYWHDDYDERQLKRVIYFINDDTNPFIELAKVLTEFDDLEEISKVDKTLTITLPILNHNEQKVAYYPIDGGVIKTTVEFIETGKF